ncbi:hypothetical protein ACCD07_15375, partial [Duganella sp. Dugasp56]
TPPPRPPPAGGSTGGARGGPTARAARARWGGRPRPRHLARLLRYPSQWRTWLGLFPFVLWHYLRHGSQQLQPVALTRLDQRPHAGPLYYEQRRFYTYEEMRRNMADWLARPRSG